LPFFIPVDSSKRFFGFIWLPSRPPPLSLYYDLTLLLYLMSLKFCGNIKRRLFFHWWLLNFREFEVR
jgi:hypothetical protein